MHHLLHLCMLSWILLDYFLPLINDKAVRTVSLRWNKLIFDLKL